MPHNTKPGDVLFMMTNGAYNDGTRVITFRIEDESTGRFIIDVDLSGPEWTSFVGTHHVRKAGYLLQLHYLLLGEGLDVHIEIHRTDPTEPYFEAGITGEQFAAILGNAVTRVAGARIGEGS